MKKFKYDKGVLTLLNDDGTAREDTCINFATKQFIAPSYDIRGRSGYSFARDAKISSAYESRTIGKIYKFIWECYSHGYQKENFEKYVSLIEILLINMLKNKSITYACDYIDISCIENITLKEWSKYLAGINSDYTITSDIFFRYALGRTNPFIKKLCNTGRLRYTVDGPMGELLKMENFEKCDKIVKSEYKQYEKIKETITNISTILEQANIPHYIMENIEITTTDNIWEYNTIDEAYDRFARMIYYILIEDKIIALKNVCKNTDLDNIHNFREFKIQVDNEYHRAEQEIFANRQNRLPAYENDTFTIYIPKTYNECNEIGSYFHNCVGNYEWTNFLKSGRRGLFIVTRKSNNEKVACCDCDDREVIQKLQKYNNKITDRAILNFIKDYEKIIYERN